jgi:hypothetical protein
VLRRPDPRVGASNAHTLVVAEPALRAAHSFVSHVIHRSLLAIPESVGALRRA